MSLSGCVLNVLQIRPENEVPEVIGMHMVENPQQHKNKGFLRQMHVQT